MLDMVTHLSGGRRHEASSSCFAAALVWEEGDFRVAVIAKLFSYLISLVMYHYPHELLPAIMYNDHEVILRCVLISCL